MPFVVMNNPLQNKIEQITQEAIEMFSKTSERLFLERAKNEHKLTKQYSGREILELLQNIDDAYDSSCGHPCTASFKLEHDCLIVSNYGIPFTIDTLQRLCQGSVSSKKGKYIGSKGLGFRSILNWSRKIEIYSQATGYDYIAVRFSTDNAKKVFDKIKDKEHIKSQIEELQNMGFDATFPIFKAPEPIEPEANLAYNTQIKIYVCDEVKEHIKANIKAFDKNVLLFLPNVVNVEFSVDEVTTIFEKTNETEKRVTICSKINDEVQSTQSFYYFEDNNQHVSRKKEDSNNIRMAVAIPVEDTEEQYKLYTFFPILNINSPFKALLHATFSLNDNRNNFESSSEDDTINREVFIKLLTFFVSKVTSLDFKERAIRVLTPISYTNNYRFPDDLARLHCVSDYLQICQSQKIFYTINKEYMSATEKCTPIIIKNSIPQPILDEKCSFSRLVQIDRDEQLFAEQVRPANSAETEDYLEAQINAVTGEWSSKQRIEVFDWWCGMKVSKLPNLLKNTKNDFITSTKEPCFLSGGIDTIPVWANINILNQEDETELLSRYKQRIDDYKQANSSSEAEKRILPRLISKGMINLQEQSSKQVLISPVNSSVENDFEKAQKFQEWLWNIWISDRKFDTTIKENDFNVPTKNNSVRKAKETYLGKEFNNNLGVILFENSGLNYEEIWCPDVEDKELYAQFLKDLGVNKFPRIYSATSEYEWNAPNFVKFVKTVRKFDYQGNISRWKLKVNTIDNIDSILRNTPTETIFKWINTDARLKASIDYEPEDSFIEYKPRISGKIYYDRWNIGWNLPSYLQYVFSRYKWIKIEDQMYSPNELMIATDSFGDLSGVYCLSESAIEKLADDSGFTFEDLKLVLLKLGVKESYLDLNSSQFYNLLLGLGSKTDEKSKKTSREIYRAIIANNRGSKSIKTKFFAESEEKSRFFSEGKVLAKNRKGRIEYKPVSEVFFSSSAVLNLNDSYFIDIPPRSGNKDSFEKILGIKPYEQDYSVSNPIMSTVDQDFQDDFKNFLPCLLTYRTGNKSAVSLSIHLVSEITVNVQGDCKKPDAPYSLLKESKSKWYIYIGNTVSSYSKIDKCKIGEAMEQVFNVYFNFPSKDFLDKVIQLYICTPEQRRYFIETDFGSSYEYESTIGEISRAGEIRSKIKEVLQIDSDSDISRLVDDIDWNDLANIKVQEKIFYLLNKANYSVEDLSKVLDHNISVAAYVNDALWHLYLQKRERLLMSIYEQCEKDNQAKLLTYWDGLDNCIHNIQITEDIKIKFVECIDKTVSKFFNDKNLSQPDNTKSEYKDVLAGYETNKRELVSFFESQGMNLNDFTNNIENHSLLYYEKSVWETKVNDFIKTCNEEDQKEQKGNDDVSDARNLSDIINSLEFINDLESGKERVPSSGKSGRGGYTERSQRKENLHNKKQGNLAEYYVILALANCKIEEVNYYFDQEKYSIIWKSGAANEVVKFEDDNFDYDTSNVDDNAGYDIELVKVNDPSKKMYIEVKSSSSSNCSFFMSIGEYIKALDIEKGGGCYRIIFVSNMATDHQKVTLIDKPISKSFDFYPTQYNVVFKKDKFENN